MTVNQRVASSSLAGGAKKPHTRLFFIYDLYLEKTLSLNNTGRYKLIPCPYQLLNF
jgi:hypothetical protein